MVISATSFAFMSLIVKSLNHISTFQLVFFRSIGTMIICITILKFLKVPLFGKNKGLLASRGIVGTISLVLFFYAIKLMPLASAVSLRYLSPFFSVVLAMYFLNEKMLKRQWVYMMIAFFGAVLIKGFDTRISLYAFSIIMISAFFSGLVYFIIRKIGKSEHPLVIVLYFSGIATISSFIGSLFQHLHFPNIEEFIQLLSLGILGYCGQYFMTKALQIEVANRVTPLKYIEAVLALFLAFVWFGEKQGIFAIVGITLVIIGVSLNSLSKKQPSA